MTASGSVSDYADTADLQAKVAKLADLDASLVRVEIARARSWAHTQVVGCAVQ